MSGSLSGDRLPDFVFSPLSFPADAAVPIPAVDTQGQRGGVGLHAVGELEQRHEALCERQRDGADGGDGRITGTEMIAMERLTH